MIWAVSLQGLRVGEAFSVLGLTLGTPSTDTLNTYVESAFVNASVSQQSLIACHSELQHLPLGDVIKLSQGIDSQAAMC